MGFVGQEIKLGKEARFPVVRFIGVGIYASAQRGLYAGEEIQQRGLSHSVFSKKAVDAALLESH